MPTKEAMPVEYIDRDLASPPEASFATAPATTAHDLTGVVRKFVVRRRDRTASEWTWASEAGHPCLRYIAYNRLHPELALPMDEDLAFVFRRGHWIEREALDELREAGYEVVEQDRPFSDRRLKVKGKIDCKIVLHADGGRVRPPVEIKGYAPHFWNKLLRARDFLETPMAYLRAVPAQLTLYLLLDPASPKFGLFYLKDKLSGKPRQIEMPLDQTYALWLWRRLRALNEYIRRRKLPPRIEFDEKICGLCAFRATCLGELPAQTSPEVLDPEQAAELVALLEDRERLKDSKRQLEEVEERISAIVSERPQLIVGEWLVKGRKVEFDQKPQPARHVTYWRKDIVRLTARVQEDDAETNKEKATA